MPVLKLDGCRRAYLTVWLYLDDNHCPQISFGEPDVSGKVRQFEMDEETVERFRAYYAEGQALQDMLFDIWSNMDYQARR